MTIVKIAIGTLTILGLLGGAISLADTVTYSLPEETSTLKKSSDPGFDLAETACAICHSVDYITTQPPNKGKHFWEEVVKKMVVVYGAPVEDADQAAIAEYLSKNY